MVVDDEESIRLIGTRMLQRLGFEVFVASDGCEALARIREQGDRIRAILLDLTMPRMDGEETFRELQRIRTDIPVVLSSGYTEEDVVQRFAGKAIAGFVHKPYNIENLRTAFKPLVDKGPPEQTSD
jgi:CheY-like chemotaxis protein